MGILSSSETEGPELEQGGKNHWVLVYRDNAGLLLLAETFQCPVTSFLASSQRKQWCVFGHLDHCLLWESGPAEREEGLLSVRTWSLAVK